MKTTTIAVLMSSMLAAGLLAQPSEVGKRREKQQDRIAQGVKSGSLTAGETANLERKEAAINQEVKTDRALNGGRLSKQEKTVINQQQNVMSRQIYKDKHNAAVQHYGNNEVDVRRSNQQQRIANGSSSGRLNAGQAARLEKSEAGINKEVRTDRAANGGHLTPGEKQQVNAQQNAMSRRIYKAKH